MRSKKQLLVIALLVGGLSVYRLATPWLEEMRERERELMGLVSEIEAVRAEAARYDSTWDKRMGESESKLALKFPNELLPSDILDYFTTSFQVKHPGRIWFLSFTKVTSGLVDLKDPNKKSPKARFERFKIRAEIGQELLLKYLEHSEAYPALVRADNFAISVPKMGMGKNTLLFESTLEFYLAPEEWLPLESRRRLAEKKIDINTGRAFFVSNESPERKPASKQILKVPEFQKIVGGSVISDENLYEAGDMILGWRIMAIDDAAKKVVLKHGGLVKEVRVK